MDDGFFDVPAGYSDADLMQAEFEALGARLAADRRKGICHHGWTLGGGAEVYARHDILMMRAEGNFPNRITDPSITHQRDIPADKALCLHCGELVAG